MFSKVLQPLQFWEQFKTRFRSELFGGKKVRQVHRHCPPLLVFACVYIQITNPQVTASFLYMNVFSLQKKHTVSQLKYLLEE